MRRCPVCRVVLEPVDYEEYRVERCPRCRGHLVRQGRLELIKRTRGRGWEELKGDAANYDGGTAVRIYCPRCRQPMTRRAILQPLRLVLDLCATCRLVWLDAGELALVQLLYEASPSGQVTGDLMRRVQELEADPVRRARFEESLKQLPSERAEPGGFVRDEFLEDLLSEIARILLRRGVRL